MFAPFCVVKINNVIQGLFLFAFGPALASYITPNLMEQASIWCFFSIAQIFVMVLIITNIVTGGRLVATSRHYPAYPFIMIISASTKDNRPAPYMDLRFIWPMGVVEPAAKAEVMINFLFKDNSHNIYCSNRRKLPAKRLILLLENVTLAKLIFHSQGFQCLH